MSKKVKLISPKADGIVTVIVEGVIMSSQKEISLIKIIVNMIQKLIKVSMPIVSHNRSLDILKTRFIFNS